MIDFSTYGLLINKPASGVNPEAKLKRERASFVSLARRQATGSEKTLTRPWFIKQPDGAVVVSLRKGTANLVLDDGKKHMLISNWEGAVKFFNDVADAAEKGELDHLLQSVNTSRKNKAS